MSELRNIDDPDTEAITRYSSPSQRGFIFLKIRYLQVCGASIHLTSRNSYQAATMADESPVGSPLSILSSDAFDGDEEHDHLDHESLMPPAKRQKRGDSSLRRTPSFPQEDALSSISSDTEGDIPNSPSNRQEDDDTHEQVTVCAWDGCNAGDMGNMDRLVEHIHAEHIETRQKKYTCEWSDCARKSMPHASGYALKAHMRSHTREKPFYCALPGKALMKLRLPLLIRL